MHTFPQLRRIERKYGDRVIVVGVHSPKFPAERETANLREAVLRYRIEHPVVNDRDFAVWNQFGGRAWPTLMFVDPQGRVNAAAFGTCTRVCHEPMYIAFTCGTGKDTYNNIQATGEFVVNVVPFEQALLDKVLVCGLPFRGGVNTATMKYAGPMTRRSVCGFWPRIHRNPIGPSPAPTPRAP